MSDKQASVIYRRVTRRVAIFFKDSASSNYKNNQYFKFLASSFMVIFGRQPNPGSNAARVNNVRARRLPLRGPVKRLLGCKNHNKFYLAAT